MRVGESDIAKVISEVKIGYPFPEIINETDDAIKSLASALARLAPEGGRLLDIGCGALDKTIVFQGMGYESYGCDDFQDPWHSQNSNLDPVLEFAEKCGVEVYSQNQHYTLPWPTESFDVVTIINVIEHLTESPRGILNFGGTYLKPGGLLLVGMPNSVNLRKRLSVLRGRSNYTPVRGFFENDGPWRGHVREFTLEETARIVEWNGFRVDYKNTYHAMTNNRLPNRVLRSVFKGLCMLGPTFRDSLLVAGRKPDGWQPRSSDPSSLQKSLTSSWVVQG